jgi:hypothetical protein
MFIIYFYNKIGKPVKTKCIGPFIEYSKASRHLLEDGFEEIEQKEKIKITKWRKVKCFESIREYAEIIPLSPP